MCICLYSYHSNPLQLFMLLHSCYSKKKGISGSAWSDFVKKAENFHVFPKKVV